MLEILAWFHQICNWNGPSTIANDLDSQFLILGSFIEISKTLIFYSIVSFLINILSRNKFHVLTSMHILFLLLSKTFIVS